MLCYMLHVCVNANGNVLLYVCTCLCVQSCVQRARRAETEIEVCSYTLTRVKKYHVHVSRPVRYRGHIVVWLMVTRPGQYVIVWAYRCLVDGYATRPVRYRMGISLFG